MFGRLFLGFSWVGSLFEEEGSSRPGRWRCIKIPERLRYILCPPGKKRTLSTLPSLWIPWYAASPRCFSFPKKDVLSIRDFALWKVRKWPPSPAGSPQSPGESFWDQKRYGSLLLWTGCTLSPRDERTFWGISKNVFPEQ